MKKQLLEEISFLNEVEKATLGDLLGKKILYYILREIRAARADLFYNSKYEFLSQRDKFRNT